MSKPNQVLGNKVPILLCGREIGAEQVRRVLHALESGGVLDGSVNHAADLGFSFVQISSLARKGNSTSI